MIPNDNAENPLQPEVGDQNAKQDLENEVQNPLQPEVEDQNAKQDLEKEVQNPLQPEVEDQNANQELENEVQIELQPEVGDQNGEQNVDANEIHDDPILQSDEMRQTGNSIENCDCADGFFCLPRLNCECLDNCGDDCCDGFDGDCGFDSE